MQAYLEAVIALVIISIIVEIISEISNSNRDIVLIQFLAIYSFIDRSVYHIKNDNKK